VLCIYLIGAIGKIGTTISNLEKSVNELQKKLDPVLDNLTFITDKSKKIVESISEQIDITRSVVQAFKMIAEDVLDFEKKIKDSIEKPVTDFLNILMGFLSGIKTISSFLKRNSE
jgi:uncharacterized protein YoxC